MIFIAPLLAAFAIAQLQNLQDPQKPALRKRLAAIGTILLALIAVILFWAWRFPFPTDDVHRTLLNGLSRAVFLIVTGVLFFFLLQNSRPGLPRLAPLLLIFVAWLDVFTHEPAQNPTAPPSIYEPGLSREKLALQPQPALGGSRAMITPSAFAMNAPLCGERPREKLSGQPPRRFFRLQPARRRAENRRLPLALPARSRRREHAALRFHQRQFSAPRRFHGRLANHRDRTKFTTGSRAKLFCRS